MALSISQTLERLYDTYGRRSYDGPDDVLGVLVHTILSQQTTRQNCERAFAALVETYGGRWQQIEWADPSELEAVIATAGLAGQKAARIQAALGRINDERGSYSLAFLRDQSVDDALRYLTSFKGVGPKTARFTLMQAAGMAFFPMDTHILRICQRLGWTESAASTEKVHRQMEAKLPAGQHYSAHMVLVRHGRQTCHARSPACSGCCIRQTCAYRSSDG